MSDPLKDQEFNSRAEAEKASALLGCKLAHEVNGKWMPCESPQHLEALIDGGVAAYRALSTKGVRPPRRVSVNPNARDADGDGMVQEGTTAERPATGKVTKITKRVKRTLVDDELLSMDAGIKARGGIGRLRTKKDGPLPEAVKQKKFIAGIVQKNFGQLDTIPQMKAALSRAFPNAKIDLVNVVDESEYKLDQPVFTPEQIVGMKGYVSAILFKSLEDKNASSRVGAVGLNSGNNAGMVGFGLASPATNPLKIYINPVSLGDSSDDYETINTGTASYLAQIRNFKKYKGSDQAHGVSRRAITNSDAELNGMHVGLHEWTHVQDYSETLDDMAPLMPIVQNWVASGKIDERKIAIRKVLERAQSFADDFRSVVLDDQNQVRREAQQLFENLGFESISDSDRALAAVRAIAARSSVAAVANEILASSLDEKMSDAEWESISVLSGYSATDKSEALAELAASMALMPSMWSNPKLVKALKNQHIKKRASL